MKDTEMKVLQIHNYFRIRGGEDVLFDTTCQALAARGHEVRVFTQDSQNIVSLKNRAAAGMRQIWPYSASRQINAILSSWKPDIVDVHNVYPLINPSMLPVISTYKLPIVLRCQDYRLICPAGQNVLRGQLCTRCDGGREYQCFLNNCRDKLSESALYYFRSMTARRNRLFLDNVTLYVPPSNCTKARLIINGFSQEQIVVLPNVASVKNSRRDPDPGQYVAYLGRISPEKGINVALEAARRTELPLRLAGDFNAIPEIESIPESAKFIGRLNREDIDKFYSKARFAIVPSIWYETFGIVIIEAMANRLPVIGSNIGGIPEIIEHGKTGFLVKPGDPDDLANKMKLLWDNPDLCRRMGEAGREKAVREYSEEAYYKKLMDIYEHAMLIHGKHNPGHQPFEGASSSHPCC